MRPLFCVWGLVRGCQRWQVRETARGALGFVCAAGLAGHPKPGVRRREAATARAGRLRVWTGFARLIGAGLSDAGGFLSRS